MSSKLLSILSAVRNDNYYENYLKRLEYTFNYTLRNIEKLNCLDKIELFVVDWGSKKKLSNEIHIFNNRYQDSIKILSIDEKFASHNNRYTTSNFFSELAENIALDYIDSEFILVQPGDQFLSVNDMYNLINILNNKKIKNLEKMFLLQREILPIDFPNKNYTFNYLDFFLENYNYGNSLINSKRIYSGGGLGGFLAKKKIFEKIGGIKDLNLKMRGYHSKSDNDILKRSNLFYSYENLSKNGILLKKLPYTDKGFRKTRKLNLNYNKEKINFSDLKKNTFPIDVLKFKENLSNKYEIFSKFYFYKNYLINKNYKLNLKSLINILSFNNLKKLNGNFNIIFVLNEIIKKMSFLNYLEIGSDNTFRINAISRENQNISIFNTLNLNDLDTDIEEWINQSQAFNDVHKCYLKILSNNNQNIKTLLKEIPIEYLSSLMTIEKIADLSADTLKLFIKNQNLFGMILIDNKNLNFIKDFEKNINFKKITSLNNYDVYLNNNLLSNKLIKELNLFFLQKKKFYYLKKFLYSFLYILLRIRIFKFNLKKKLRKKIRK